MLQTGDEAREPTAAEKAAYEASTAPQEYLVPLFDTLIPDSVQIALYQTKQAVAPQRVQLSRLLFGRRFGWL